MIEQVLILGKFSDMSVLVLRPLGWLSILDESDISLYIFVNSIKLLVRTLASHLI